MIPAEYDHLSLAEQQIVARTTTDPALQGHIVWKGPVSCLPFLAANAANLEPEIRSTLLTIVVHRQLERIADDAEHISAAFHNLARYSPTEFEAAVLRKQEGLRQSKYFDDRRMRNLPIDSTTKVPDDWETPDGSTPR